MPSSTPLPVRRARVHEAAGPAAAAFAAVLCQAAAGPFLWIRPDWLRQGAVPDGLAGILAAERLILARTASETDSLAIAEEALRDGAVPTVVVEVTRPLDLRAGRRLQLAAQAGNATGLCLIPEGAGSAAAQTRWHCAPLFDPGVAQGRDSTLMRWEIIKNKEGTLGVWNVRWNRKAHRLDVVPAAAE